MVSNKGFLFVGLMKCYVVVIYCLGFFCFLCINVGVFRFDVVVISRIIVVDWGRFYEEVLN